MMCQISERWKTNRHIFIKLMKMTYEDIQTFMAETRKHINLLESRVVKIQICRSHGKKQNKKRPTFHKRKYALLDRIATELYELETKSGMAFICEAQIQMYGPQNLV